MIGLGAPRVLVATAVFLFLVAVFALQASGEDPAQLWSEIALPAAVLGGCLLLLVVVSGTTGVRRFRNRSRRPMARYELVLSQADEAALEEVAAACEALVQAARVSLTRRISSGQPWVALESWFVPAAKAGETGTATLVLLCSPTVRDSALAALRRAYPDLSLRRDPCDGHGYPLEFTEQFRPGHVLRVRKARLWALPVAAARAHDGSNGRSTLAAIVRQQQRAGRVSCVRWCLMPAADQLDSRAVEALEQLAGRERNAAREDGVRQAIQAAGGAMSFVELQAAVEAKSERGREERESFSELQNTCRRLLSPALSHRGANHLTERVMVVRQGLYRRRWARGVPPLCPDLSGATLMSPRELAVLMELPSLGSEHALPLRRNTVPHLPIPTDVPRARVVELPLPSAERK